MPVEARAYPRPLPNPEWLGKLEEEILEPELPIVDPHHHLWDHLGSRYLLDELLADLGSGHNIVATVFIQCGSGYRTSGPEEMRAVGESEFARRTAEEADRRGTKAKICAGIVSFADLRLANVDAVLEAQIEAAGGRFRGIRQIAAHDPAIVGGSSYVPPPGLMDDPAFRRGLKRLPAHDLTFEAWIYHPQIKTLTEVARESPEVKIVLNHFGGPLGVGPYKRDEVFSLWRADIRALAACPNVYVKLGGLAMIVNAFDFHLAPLPPSSGELANAWRPYVETCLEAFGANRCMFESNFPVDKGACSYPVLWNAFKRLASGAPPSEKSDLFAGTASGFYRLRHIGL
ncbi:MAG TPA: amidohydrolase family protein [Stellaceae bacterium]|jgi:L-fuconolactonase|nr:amidohydrolase family protein [Stellaceae bacterium]